MDVSFWLWFAGQIDGDGTVGVCSGSPRLSLKKARKGFCALQLIKDKLGGTVYHRPSTNLKRQDQATWLLDGEPARNAIQQLQSLSRLKRAECRLVAGLSTGRCRFTAEKDGCLHRFNDTKECADEIGVHRCSVHQKFARLRSATIELKGWKLTKLDSRKSIHQTVLQKLRQQRKAPLQPLKGSLHPAYIAGFFDAEGSLDLRDSCNPRVRMGQNDPAVLHAIRQQYGGSLYTTPNQRHTQLQINSLAGRVFLKLILPFCVEKKAQVELALTATPQTFRAIEAQLKPMRGNATNACV